MSELKNKEEYLSAVHQTMSEISDLLAKSGYGEMKKAEDKEEEKAKDKMEKNMGMEMHKDDPSAEMAPEAPAAEMAPEAEAPAPEMEQEAAEGEMDEGELESLAQGMSDEELDMMLQVLSAEKAARGQAMEGEQAPEAPAAPEMAQEPSMDKSLAKAAKITCLTRSELKMF